MSNAIIIEDDEAIGKLLSELCGKLGVTATVIRNGKEGFDKAKAAQPELLVLDLLLPGMDGFKIAEGLKAAGALKALVVVTGVYKDPKVQKDFAERYGAEVLLKPVRVDDFSRIVSKKLGLAAAPAPVAPPPTRTTGESPAVVPPMEGSLRQKRVPQLLVELFRAKANGTLELTAGQVKKRLFLNRGFVRFAQSNVKAENVGGMQVAEGKLSEAQFAAAVEKAKSEGIGVAEALAVSGTMTHDAVAQATRRQVEEVCITAFAWADGTFKFVPGSTDKVQDARANPVQAMLAGYRRYVTPEQARARLSAYAASTVARSPEFDRELYAIRAVFQGESLTPMVNGRLTVQEILGRAKEAELPLLLGVIELGLATAAGAAAAQKPTATFAQTAANPNRAFTEEEKQARAAIVAEHARVTKAEDLYLVLKLTRSATADEVKAAYLPLAKRFHADAFSGLSLGDAEPKLAELFGKISEANTTLSDPKKRADYDVLLERRAAGLPTDMEVIFKAEGAFNRADALIKQGRFIDAEGALKEALKLDASVAQYHAALGFAILKGRGAAAAAEARAACDRALQIQPEFHLARLYKAMAVEQEGDSKAAEKLLREVLAAQPDNAEAARELRAVRERSKKDDNKGLLGKLFKR